MELLPVIILGLVVGCMAASLGLGGGVLIVPLLPWLTQLSQRETIATSLFTIFLIVSVNSYFFHRKKLVIWRVALFMGPATAIGAYMAARLTDQMSEAHLKVVLALVICTFAVRILLQKKAVDQVEPDNVDKRLATPSLFYGGLAGAISGFTGLGSGMILSPTLLHFKIVANQFVSPTSNAIMIFTTLFGSLAYIEALPDFEQLRWGVIHLDIVAILALCAWVMGYFFRPLQEKVTRKQRRIILGTILSALGLRTLYVAILM